MNTCGRLVSKMAVALHIVVALILVGNTCKLVTADPGNIAVGKRAYQSSTYNDHGQLWSAGNAVDGKKICTSIDYQHFSATDYLVRDPWWRVDLGKIYNIKRVVVYGQPEDNHGQLTGFKMYLTKTLPNTNELPSAVYTNVNYGNGIFDIPTSIDAQFCTLVPEKEAIVLCEVEIYDSVNLIQKIRANVSTSMSSTGDYNKAITSWKSDNAIDNIYSEEPNSCSCCSGTSGNEQPWWQMNLGREYVIGAIKIFGRSDDSSHEQHSNLSIFVSSTSMDSVNGQVNGTGIFSGNSNDGPYTYTLSFQPPIAFQFLMIRKFVQGVMTICEVKLFENDSNLAYRLRDYIHTEQSSTWTDNGYSYTSDKAIDGIPRYDVNGRCHCCSVTSGPSPSWWQIDLRNRYYINKIEVFGRASEPITQIQDAKIYVSNSSMRNNTSNGMKLHTISANEIVHLEFLKAPSIIAQYLQVMLVQDVLTICEIRLYEPESKCDTGRFGIRCSRQCHCADKAACNSVNGTCVIPGCLPGWTGSACEDACGYRRYGSNCQLHCNCKDNMECNRTTGFCINGCPPGWHGQACEIECGHAQFGDNCTQTCHCKNFADCNHVNGSCPGRKCAPGWKGQSCDTECEHAKFGEDCSHACHCKNDNNCNNVNGSCPGGECAPGWKGQACETECEHGKFGEDCSRTCHCKNNNDCNNVNGSCPRGGCADGWKGQACDTECEHAKFGEDCSHTCHCKKDNDCSNVNGSCPGGECAPGWQGQACETECGPAKFGEKCFNTCHCINNTDCNHVNGSCPGGKCAPGWKGQACDAECGHAKFGEKCFNTCHCINNTDCNHVNGSCPGGKCAPGWKGQACDAACDHGRFGEYCSFICHCKEGDGCNHVNGTCPGGCAPGWQGMACDSECDFGSFGDECLSRCHCINETKCNHMNGTCEMGDCAPGWLGSSCDIACTKGSFGYGCTSHCHCINSTNCNHINGLCYEGLCDPGWFGTSCDKECTFGSFGDECLSRCHCTNETKCNHINGTCEMGDCAPGWLGSSCDIACDHGRFGEYCSFICHCKEGDGCNHVNGTCPGGCAPGWQGMACDSECDFGSFGDECLSRCHCINETKCNHMNGTCEMGDCAPGWLGSSCDIACTKGSFGYGCTSHCHCINSTNCNHINGLCYEGLCDPGWFGTSCDKECTFGSFGDECLSRCHCINETKCNHINGTCEMGDCAPGWLGSSCDIACSFGSFGDGCSHKCHCINSTACNHITGTCDESKCDPGWFGSSCNKACKRGSFGYGCNSTCHCKSDTPCSPETGYCEKGCERTFKGKACQIAVERVTQDGTSSTSAIAGGTVAAIVLIAAGVVIAFIIIKRKRTAKERSSTHNQFSHLDRTIEDRSNVTERSNVYARENRSFKEEEEETKMNSTGENEYYSFGKHLPGTKIHELWDYIHEKMENNCEKLFTEFKTLPQGLVHSYKSADNIVNRGKNRYREMYAYDHTRVVLEDIIDKEDGKHTDYINACYIDGYEKVKKFVASQGPTKQMIDDFWRMVWQLKSDKIVMLTNLVELGTTKCLQYWPKEDEEDECTYGNVVIKLLETEKNLDYNIRYLEVRKDGEASRKIRQFHFKSWPDKDVPDSTWCLVNFWRAVDTNAPSKAGPIVVHCSAGVGRTGTFIGLDNMVSQARNEGCVRPLQIVQALRAQRVNMVQTREQYVYLHEAVADALLFGTHILWTKQFQEMLTFMLQKEKGDTRSRLQIQFELIEKSVVNSSSDVAESPEYSNVETLLSESDAYRPKLKNRGSKLVQQLRAIYIPNYKGKSTFLVSMSPDKGTMEEFWSLVDDSNIKTIIMLTEQSTTCYRSSCELGSSANNGNRFSVNKIEEKIRKGYTERTFTFKESAREEEEHLTTVKQFEYTAWKDGYPVPGDTRSLLDMIVSVQRWQPHLSESQPVLIHCGDGCSRSGIVCVLLNELQRMKYEGGHINIVESVKMMKKRQSHLISNYEQHKFCYDLIMAHIQLSEVYQNL